MAAAQKIRNLARFTRKSYQDIEKCQKPRSLVWQRTYHIAVAEKLTWSLEVGVEAAEVPVSPRAKIRKNPATRKSRKQKRNKQKRARWFFFILLVSKQGQTSWFHRIIFCISKLRMVNLSSVQGPIRIDITACWDLIGSLSSACMKWINMHFMQMSFPLSNLLQ